MFNRIPNDGRSYIPFPEYETVYDTGTSYIKPTTVNPVIGKCPKCGLELYSSMMYCCYNSPCPSGLGSRIIM